ncbi:MAG: N-6 DNA methylase [Spirochaetales bacterium]|nr:N-6 DNA methylase [Spirochaetales bacterium]
MITTYHTKSGLIDVFAYASNLLRQAGMREGIERFTEFSNLLFLKLFDEIEEDREKRGEGRRFDKKYCWSGFYRKPANELLEYINRVVLPEFIKRYNIDGDVFDRELGIRNADILKDIVDRLSNLNLSEADSDVKGDAFEYFLKNSVTVGNDLGEYFTPRHIVKLVVDLVDPKLGETVYDPCCGTGGFLIQAFQHMKHGCRKTLAGKMILGEVSIYGRELTGTAKIAKMNMILSDDGYVNIRQMDSLSEPVNGQFDVVLTNYPFSQLTEYGPLYGLATKEGNPVFLKHIIDALKPGGRAGVVVPDGVVFDSGKEFIKVRKLLIETCNVIAVIQLDSAVFRPYTSQPTSILVFEKGIKTGRVWFFEVVEDGFKKTTSKKGRPPITHDDLPELRSLWGDRRETMKSFFVDAEIIRSSAYKLFMNYYKPHKKIKDLKKLGEICEAPIIGGTPPKKGREFYGGRHLWATIADMKDKYVNDTVTKMSDKGRHYLKNKLIKKGTLLMSFKLTLGKTAIAGKDLFTNEAICGLVPKDRDDESLSEYLYYILPLINFLPYAQRASKGYTLNKKLIPCIEIPFPSKKKRLEIIRHLKEKLDRLNAEKTRFRQEIDERERDIQDYFEKILF